MGGDGVAFDESNPHHIRLRNSVKGNEELQCLLGGLYVSIGLLVVLTNNSADHWLGKNSIGRVVHIDSVADTVTIQPLFLGKGKVKPNVAVKRMDMKTHTFEGRRLTFRTFPMKPAVGMTHMCIQGLQFEDNYPLLLNNERIARNAYGTIYMFFSRHCDPAYICCLHPVCEEDYIVSPEAQCFDNSLSTPSNDNDEHVCEVVRNQDLILGYVTHPRNTILQNQDTLFDDNNELTDDVLIKYYDEHMAHLASTSL